MTFVLGDFNPKSNNWCKNDTTSHEGSMIDAVTSNFRLRQLIQEPTHTNSCTIDLVFTSQPNLVIESGVHLSLHPNCHHQVVFAKFNLSVLYPPPYKKTVWFYGKCLHHRATHSAITCSKLTIETVEQGVKCVRS